MPTLTFTDGAEIYVSPGSVDPNDLLTLYFLGGDDTLQTIGWTIAYMGDGDDYVTADAGGAVYGESGRDSFDINSVQGTFDGGIGADLFNIYRSANLFTRLSVYGGADDDTFNFFVDMGWWDIEVSHGRGNSLSGGDGNDTFNGNGHTVGLLYGGPGDDVFAGLVGSGSGPGAFGGIGDDTYYVDPGSPYPIVEYPGEGTDTVVLLYASAAYVKPANVENLLVQVSPPSNTITGDDLDNVLAGTPLADSIYGLGGNDVLRGYAGNDLIGGGHGNDYLDGGAGADSMDGGDGDDRYIVDDPLDSIVDIYGQNDAVHAYVSYALGPHALVETMTTMWGAGTDAINLTGNGFGQSIYGNAGPNVLDGGGGIDYLVGGPGNDRYFVDNARDVIIELAGEGDDWVSAAVSYTLGAGVSVETMNTTDGAATTALDLTGNEFGQSLYGNAGTNTLSGNGGSDYLVAMEGNDVLIGGSGTDYLAGGEGADTFFFSEFETGDRILDFASGADKLDIGGLISQSSFTFIDSSPFTGVAGEGRYAGGLFQLDVDGNGTPDFAVALNGPLTASDFTFNGSGSGGGFWDY